jgi:Ca2+-binding RTX toxin-like protein
MLGQTKSPQVRAMALVGLLLAALSLAVVVGSADRADAAPKDAKRCWPNDRYKNNDKIPAQYDDHTKYANCGDCSPVIATDVGKCELWFGAQTSDGGEGGISHKGWPGLTGIRWQVTKDKDRGESVQGSQFNDGLYGRHGSDTIFGGDGDDVIWGDSKISKLNGSKQKDVLDGGDGDDWIYASHGKNTITAGAGDDHVIAYYGRGTIDCGPGKDEVTVLKKTPYKIKNCEKVKHPGK